MSLTKKSVQTIVLTIAMIHLFSFSSTQKNEFKYAEAVISATGEAPVSGILKFQEVENKGVKMDLEIIAPSKRGQSVAVHLHEHGMCGNAGNDAHGHWNPTGKQHGQWGSGSFHSGDIGNISLDSNGRGRLAIVTDLWSIGGPETTNIIGKGVIIHSGLDDYTSQPAGNSGPRIGCGIVTIKTN